MAALEAEQKLYDRVLMQQQHNFYITLEQLAGMAIKFTGPLLIHQVKGGRKWMRAYFSAGAAGDGDQQGRSHPGGGVHGQQVLCVHRLVPGRRDQASRHRQRRRAQRRVTIAHRKAARRGLGGCGRLGVAVFEAASGETARIIEDVEMLNL